MLTFKVVSVVSQELVDQADLTPMSKKRMMRRNRRRFATVYPSLGGGLPQVVMRIRCGGLRRVVMRIRVGDYNR
jgi:hypothetical protein